MSEQNVAPAPEAPQQSSISPEALAQIKDSFERNLNKMYFSLIDHIRSLPIHVGMMQRAFQHLDDGLFCIEKAIRMISDLPLSPVSQSEAKVVEKVVDAVEEGSKVIEGVLADAQKPQEEPAP